LPARSVAPRGGRSAALWEDLGRVAVVRMDALPVRPDIFDPGGLVRALRGLLGEEVGLKHYESAPPVLSVHVDPALALSSSYRPFIRCAVVRGLDLDEVGLRQVMKLQELLHWALGRDRKLASIGVYALAGLKERISYRAVHPDELSFVPLQSADGRALTPRQILAEHPKGQAYAHLLKDHERFPLLVDEAGQVLSMPPIINSHATRLTEGRHDVFIDVTGVTERAVDKALHTLVTSLLELFPGRAWSRCASRKRSPGALRRASSRLPWRRRRCG
jgi:phenylalanyl-tRNA synthetase beta chain